MPLSWLENFRFLRKGSEKQSRKYSECMVWKRCWLWGMSRPGIKTTRLFPIIDIPGFLKWSLLKSWTYSIPVRAFQKRWTIKTAQLVLSRGERTVIASHTVRFSQEIGARMGNVKQSGDLRIRGNIGHKMNYGLNVNLDSIIETRANMNYS